MEKREGHVLIVPMPLQGHVSPLMKLSHRIAKHGVQVTFFTTEFLQAQLVAALPELDGGGHRIRLVSFPDGLEPDDDRKDQRKFSENIRKNMPVYLEDFIKKANEGNGDHKKITGVIIDAPLGWALEIPKKFGIKQAIYWCSSTGCLALVLQIPKLIEDKLIDTDGTPLKNEKIQLSPIMPAMSTNEFTWYFPSNPDLQKSMFQHIQAVSTFIQSSDWVICNWFHELDPSVHNVMPNIVSVGPLLTGEQPSGSFCSEDLSCITWLDKQPPGSVIYVAFGSTSKFSQQQIDELARGLELANRRFLWVAWSGLRDGVTLKYPDGFLERVANLGKLVEWAPQEKVLAHPSVACFLSHCGWNSTLESLSMGVPFLCWPYFGDQLYIQTCICESWKVGLRFDADENGIICSHEIKQKVEEFFCNEGIRENALKLKEMARKSVGEGGSSSKSLEYLIHQMKG
ncbi:hypothetical protein RJ640_003275 [Escallonia rubra]|uniref:Glycosyltransferase n=1 Tax=Escallonia rubra TaxID=112253 RepID=A0AA88QB51_9ASTE|nr:hypothetical protein RJ640_003275 [Escallonia rubra]